MIHQVRSAVAVGFVLVPSSLAMAQSGPVALPVSGEVGYPALSPDGKRLAFARKTANGWRVFVGAADGRNAKQVSHGPGNDLEPSWRSDGALLAFASNRKGNFDIWGVKPDGTGLRQITSGAQDEHNPQFSPRPFGLFNPGDIGYRTVVGRKKGQVAPNDLKLLEMLAKNSTNWELYKDKFDLKPHAQYHKLLLVEGQGAKRRLVTMRENGAQRQILDAGMPGAYFSPTWDRTGDTIGFVRHHQGKDVIYMAGYPMTTDLNESEGKPRWGVDLKSWRQTFKRLGHTQGLDTQLSWSCNAEILLSTDSQGIQIWDRPEFAKNRAITLTFLETPLARGLTWSANGRNAIIPVKAASGVRFQVQEIPIPTLDVINIRDFADQLQPKDHRYLELNSFVAAGRPRRQMYHVYEETDYSDLPVFVTSDSLLHLNHLIFDYLLRETEKEHLFPAVLALTEHYLRSSLRQMRSSDPKVAEAATRNAAFFTVAARLALGAVETGKLKSGAVEAGNPLNEDLAALRAKTMRLDNARIAKLVTPLQSLLKSVPANVTALANQELALVRQHSGMGESPIFGGVLTGVGQPAEPLLDTRIDYSDFIPRGHYTRSEVLRRYFLLTRWLAGGPFRRSTAGTRQALLIVAATDETASKRLGKVLNVVGTFVGQADDADIPTYARLARHEFGGAPMTAHIADDARIAAFLRRVEQLPEPRIAPSRGPAFRVFPQPYTPDAETMQELIYDRKAPDVGTEDVPRYFALGLDVMAVLGSDRAKQILDNTQFQGTFFNFNLKETQYANYETQFHAQKQRYAKWTATDWNRNLYTRTLSAFQPLLKPNPKAQFKFTRNQAWVDKNLNAALAAWAELKHDTLPKQPVAIEAGSEGGITEAPLFEEPRGFVEPAPLVYQRLAALADAERSALQAAGYLTPAMKQRLDTYSALLQMVRNLEAKQSQGQAWTAREVEQLRFYGAYQEHLTLVTAEGEGGSMEGNDMAIISDVASAFSTRLQKLLALEEGVGRALPLYVAVERNGRRELACGGVFTYYEFTHPAEDRLTDEKWREMLDSETPPLPPTWTSSFISRMSE